MESSFAGVRSSLNQLIQLPLDAGKAQYEASQHTYERFCALSIGLIALSLLAAAAVGVWLVRSITAPLDYAVRIARGVAAGDLTQTVEVASTNEMGQLLRAMQEMNASLQSIVGEVRAGSHTIATAAGEIASGNLDLSSRTEQQASSLEETASSMEELTGTVKQNADHARQASALAVSASAVAVKGGAVVQEVVQTRRHQRLGPQDRGHHRRHRQHRFPDQHPGPERRRRSGARGRAGQGLCRGGDGGAQPGPPLGGRRQGDHGTDQ
jgi:methyl-accepting chemotaxis protein